MAILMFLNYIMHHVTHVGSYSCTSHMDDCNNTNDLGMHTWMYVPLKWGLKKPSNQQCNAYVKFWGSQPSFHKCCEIL
jgi:hypothetical protein